jgi:hypothetical protein
MSSVEGNALVLRSIPIAYFWNQNIFIFHIKSCSGRTQFLLLP